jgi:hypothetical protein
VPALLVALALVVGLAGVAANATAEHRELDRLIARVLDAQDAIAYSDHRVAATVDYTLPLLFGASVSARVRAGLQQLVADAAAGQVDGLAQERTRAAAVRVLPWHRALGRAKRALMKYLDARVSYLRSVATDTQALYVEHPELVALLDEARAAFRQAGGPAQQHRVDVAFAGGTHPA